jgi:hypothetical protein
MIEIPIGKALIAEKNDSPFRCGGCFFFGYSVVCRQLKACVTQKGERVVFKLVDYPPKEEKDV